MIFNRIFPIGAVGADVRERDILVFISRGLSNKGIAQALKIAGAIRGAS